MFCSASFARSVIIGPIFYVYQVNSLKQNVRLCIQPLSPEGEEWGATLVCLAQQLMLGEETMYHLPFRGVTRGVFCQTCEGVISHTICVVSCSSPSGNSCNMPNCWTIWFELQHKWNAASVHKAQDCYLRKSKKVNTCLTHFQWHGIFSAFSV